MPKIMVQISKKESNGNYGSDEVSLAMEMDVEDTEAGYRQMFNYLKPKLKLLLRELQS